MRHRLFDKNGVQIKRQDSVVLVSSGEKMQVIKTLNTGVFVRRETGERTVCPPAALSVILEG